VTRRKARTEADALEVLCATITVLRKREAANEVKLIPFKDKYLVYRVNEELSKRGSQCVAIPHDLYTKEIDCTKEGLSPPKRTGLKLKTKGALASIAEARGFLLGLTRDDIQDLVLANQIEGLRRQVCSVENHGVPLILKALYHSVGIGPWRHSEETMEILDATKAIRREGASTYYLATSVKVEREIQKRIKELREIASPPLPKNDADKKALKEKARKSAAPAKKEKRVGRNLEANTDQDVPARHRQR